MDYKNLVQLWSEQHEKFRDWQFSLLRSPNLLRSRLEEILDPPEKTWKESESGAINHYIEIVDFYGKEEVNRKPPREDSITDEGVLVFGIGITFDHGVNSFPKQNIYTPVAVRVVTNGPEFCLFNRDSDRPDNEWTDNIDEFCKLLISRYEDSFKHDPYTDFNSQRNMGFF